MSRSSRPVPFFSRLADNHLNDPCMATPAISDGMIIFRTQHFLFGIGRQTTARNEAPKIQQ